MAANCESRKDVKEAGQALREIGELLFTQASR
jgi:hypothetical protein